MLLAMSLMGADLRLINHRNFGAEPVADIEVRPAPLQGIDAPVRLVPLAMFRESISVSKYMLTPSSFACVIRTETCDGATTLLKLGYPGSANSSRTSPSEE